MLKFRSLIPLLFVSIIAASVSFAIERLSLDTALNLNASNLTSRYQEILENSKGGPCSAKSAYRTAFIERLFADPTPVWIECKEEESDLISIGLSLTSSKSFAEAIFNDFDRLDSVSEVDSWLRNTWTRIHGSEITISQLNIYRSELLAVPSATTLNENVRISVAQTITTNMLQKSRLFQFSKMMKKISQNEDLILPKQIKVL